jgi:hypothetical protein
VGLSDTVNTASVLPPVGSVTLTSIAFKVGCRPALMPSRRIQSPPTLYGGSSANDQAEFSVRMVLSVGWMPFKSAPKPMGVRMLSFTSSTRMLPDVMGGGGIGSAESRMSLKVLLPLRK